MSSIRTNAKLLLLAQGLGLALALIFDMLLSRTLGKEMRGLYAVVFSSATLIAATFGLSLHTSLSWAAATGRARGPSLTGLTLSALLLGSVLAEAAYGLLFVLAPSLVWNHVFSSQEGPEAAKLVAFLIPCVLADSLGQAALNGADEIGLMALQRVAYATLRVTAALVLFALLGLRFGGIVALFLLIGLEQLLVPNLLLKQAMRGLSFRGVSPLLRRCLGYSLKRHVGTVSMILSGRIAVLMVNGLVGLGAAGVYAVATALAETAALVNTVIFQASLHRIGAADEPTARKLTEQGARMSVLLMLLLSAVAIPVVWIGVPIFWGKGFGKAAPLFAILMVGYVLMGTNPIAIYFGVHRSQPLVATLFAVIGPMVGLPSLYFLTRAFGVTGAAWAATLGYTAVAGTMVTWYRVQTGTPIGRVLLPKRKDLAMLAEEVVRTLKALRR